MTVSIILFIILFLINTITTHYVPRANAGRLHIPENVVVNEQDGGPQIEDRLRKPEKTKEQAQEDFDKMVDWKSSRQKTVDKSEDMK